MARKYLPLSGLRRPEARRLLRPVQRPAGIGPGTPFPKNHQDRPRTVPGKTPHPRRAAGRPHHPQSITCKTSRPPSGFSLPPARNWAFCPSTWQGTSTTPGPTFESTGSTPSRPQGPSGYTCSSTPTRAEIPQNGVTTPQKEAHTGPRIPFSAVLTPPGAGGGTSGPERGRKRLACIDQLRGASCEYGIECFVTIAEPTTTPAGVQPAGQTTPKTAARYPLPAPRPICHRPPLSTTTPQCS